jgi:hypothetical protein
MVYAHSPNCRVNPSSPEAAAICDRCGRQFNHCDLIWQFDYRGDNLQNLGYLVCQTCLDVPQEQLRPKMVSPDPEPVLNARPPAWAAQEGAASPDSGPVYLLIPPSD